MLALRVSEIGQIFGALLCFTIQPHVKIVLLDPYFSFNILKILILNKYLTKYFRILITSSLFYRTLKSVILHMYLL